MATFIVLKDPKKFSRILSFLDPWKYGQDVGYQLKQSLLAIGSGGFFGLGPWAEPGQALLPAGRPYRLHPLDYILPELNGYSIGAWHDEDGDGVFDMLAIETRGMKGPRSFDSAAVVLHENDKTVVHEELRRIDANTLEDRITTIDDALTRPWTVSRRYSLEKDPVWVEYVCAEGNRHLKLGDEWYFANEETGTLDPTRVGQARLVPETQ